MAQTHAHAFIKMIEPGSMTPTATDQMQDEMKTLGVALAYALLSTVDKKISFEKNVSSNFFQANELDKQNVPPYLCS